MTDKKIRVELENRDESKPLPRYLLDAMVEAIGEREAGDIARAKEARK